MGYLPNAKLEEWKPFPRKNQCEKYEEYDNSMRREFENSEVGHLISTAEFKKKYNIKNTTFAKYQKLTEIKKIHNDYQVERQGNFFVKVN